MAFLVATTSLPAVYRPSDDRWNAARSCQNGKTGPGILVVKGKYKLRMNKCNKEPFIDTIVYSKGILSVGARPRLLL